MSTTDAVKPSYLGLLNAIAIAERNAGVYLRAWADTTPDPELRRALALVAAREATHGEVFRQRIERLGFSLLDKDDPMLAERLRVYGDSARSRSARSAAARPRRRRSTRSSPRSTRAWPTSRSTRSRATPCAGTSTRSAIPASSSGPPTRAWKVERRQRRRPGRR